ncbi:aldehyde dehydrogenase family protein [Paracandidimonas soli]|uniref:aldehyde dehydrogenase family protein n=1 Tax=Paracandidimonas soli TaxID=1917182 RepID=UPI00333F42B2
MSADALNLVGGTWQPSLAGRVAESQNPADGSVLGVFPDSGREDARMAVEEAAKAFNRAGWSQNPRLRQMVLLRWADRMEQAQESLAKLLTLENGKVLAQSRGEIAAAVSEIRYYAGLARYLPGHVFEVEPGCYSTLIKEAAGVTGIIVPWNAPAVLLIRSLAPALAAGCTAVVKPAAQTALVSAAMIRALHEADGLPDGVVNLLSETGADVASFLVESPDVEVISFTGSNQVGQKIMAAAAPTMKRLSLELGGKSCCLVFDDVDVAPVADALARAATIISGQQCTAARRVLVHASRYEEMKAALAGALGSLRVGNGMDEGVQMGPLIDEAACSHVESRIQATLDAADEVVLRGGRPEGAASSSFLLPTLVAHRDTGAFFIQEEIFGPLLVLESFEDEAEAVGRANHTEYGLSASIWTRHGARAMRVARALRNGTVWINDHNKLFAEAETGGYRRSGLGRLHGYDALLDFLETKHIYQDAGVVGV